MSNDRIERKIERPFTIVYNDFIDNSGVLSCTEKMVMLVLMRYGEKSFPSVPKIARSVGTTDRTVQNTIKSLIKKGIVKKEYRFSEKGDHTTNIYTIIDNAEVWAAKTEEEMKAAAEETELEKAMRIVKEHGGIVNFPENAKKPVSDMGVSEAGNLDNSSKFNKNDSAESEKSQEVEADQIDKNSQKPAEADQMNPKPAEIDSKSQVPGQSDRNSQEPTEADQTNQNPTGTAQKSQEVPEIDRNRQKSKETDRKEQYSMEFLHSHYGYDLIRPMHHAHDENVDSVFSVLYDVLNSKSAYIRVGQEEKPAEVVKSKLLKLDHECLEYVIQKFKDQTDRIQAPIPWLITVLYKGREQFDLDITNQVSHDMWT